MFNAPTDYHLTQIDVVQPDIAVIDARRRHIIAPRKVNAAPDLIIEILFESTSARDRSLKRDLYQRAGVPEYWIVDPEARNVEGLRADAEGIYQSVGVHGDRIEFRTDRLHAVVDLTKVW